MSFRAALASALSDTGNHWISYQLKTPWVKWKLCSIPLWNSQYSKVVYNLSRKKDIISN